MFMEEKLLTENVITRDHIDELYTLFVNICDSTRFSMTPLDFINIFSTISEKKSLDIDKEFWNHVFFLIDHDKDGRISFQDFVKYIYGYLKIIFGEVGEKLSFNRIK